MPKDLKFNIRLIVDGKEQVAQATANIGNLAKSFDEARSSAVKSRDEIIKFSQLGASFQNVIGGIQQLSGALNKLSAAAATQQEVETKLANNMRNTMSARQEDIQSIYNLCSAQQQLGIIGDEVQLSGAQELATYLTKKSSLEALIPVMNDMIAQQYGLNATSEAAANIATMLGKVMDGQTGALSRYGYKFDEVQEQILKFGTEEQRAAVLAEVVESAVGGMNEALAQTDAGKAKQAANEMGDLEEKVGALYARISPVITRVGELGLAFAALGSIKEGIKGIAAGMATLRLATLRTTVAAYAQAAASKVAAVAQTLWNAQLRYGAQAATAFAAGAATAAVKATVLRVAIIGLMAATGVGVALAAVCGILGLLSNKAGEAAQEMQEAQKAANGLNEAVKGESYALTEARALLELNIATLKDFNGSKEQERKLVDQMNNTYGEAMGYYSSVNDWYNALIANSETYCLQMVKEAEMRELANKIGSAELESREIRGKIERGELSDVREKEKRTKLDSLGDIPILLTSEVEIVGSSELEKANSLLAQNEIDTKHWKEQLQAVAKELSDIKMPKKGATERPEVTKTLKTKTEKPKKEEKKPATFGSIDWYEEQMQTLRQKIESTADTELAASLQKVYENLQANLKELKIKIGIEKPDADEAAESLSGIENLLKKHPLKELEFDDKSLSKSRSAFKSTAESVQQLGDSFAQVGQNIEMPALNIAGTIAQAIATLALSFAEASRGAAGMGPFSWIAFAATGLATLTATIASVKSATAFADGGVVYGPVLGLVGEYSGARSNPEIIAPLSKLRGLIGTDNGLGGEVKFIIEGDKLAGVLQKRSRKLARL